MRELQDIDVWKPFLNNLIFYLDSNILNKTEISFLFFTKSLCLDKLPDYSKNAEESASKSVKNTKFKTKFPLNFIFMWFKTHKNVATLQFKLAKIHFRSQISI